MGQLNSVALLSAAYPPYSWGGIDTQTYDIAHYLSKVGIDVTVFCGRAERPTAVKESKNLTLYRLPVLDAPPRVVWFQLQNLHRILQRIPDFDIVHTQHSSGTLYGLVKNKFKKPWIVSFHEHELRRLLTYLELKPWKFSMNDSIYYALGYPLFNLMTRIEKGADHYIVCGTAGLTDYLNFSNIDPAKTTMIRNGIDLEKIKSMIEGEDRSKASANEEFTIFTCGRLYATKGIPYLIEAMQRVTNSYQNVRLKIFGKGPLESMLRHMIDSMHLEDNVSLEGYVSYRRLIREMSQCDLAVFPTLLEVGASIAIMEAMACRKAVVAFDYPFTRDIIKHSKTGYLVPRKNPEMLADAIILLLQDDSLRSRLGDNAFNYIVQYHDYKKIVKKYVEVYSSLVASRGNHS